MGTDQWINSLFSLCRYVIIPDFVQYNRFGSSLHQKWCERRFVNYILNQFFFFLNVWRYNNVLLLTYNRWKFKTSREMRDEDFVRYFSVCVWHFNINIHFKDDSTKTFQLFVKKHLFLWRTVQLVRFREIICLILLQVVLKNVIDSWCW